MLPFFAVSPTEAVVSTEVPSPCLRRLFKMFLDDCFDLAPARGVLAQKFLLIGKSHPDRQDAKIVGTGRELRDRAV